MSMGLILMMAAASTSAALVTLARIIGLDKVLRYAKGIDIGFTIFGIIALGASLTGVLIAIVAGLMMTTVLGLLRLLQRAVGGLREAQGPAPEPEEDWCPGGRPDRL